MDNRRIIDIIQRIPNDLRVEVVLADLANSGFDLNDVFVKPEGIFKRKFGKDIAKVETIERKNGDVFTLIKLNREGLYDCLPQTLFHNPPKKPNPFKKASEMVGEVRIRIKEEQNARDFFFAYEIEFFRQRLTMELNERKMLETITYSMDDEAFLTYWDLPMFFSKRQKGILFYLLPIFHKIRSDFRLMEEAYSAILKDNVNMINLGLKSYKIPNRSAINKLGDTILSINSILGEKNPSTIDTIQVMVNNISEEKIFNYLPKGLNHRIINHLNFLFMPLHVETEIKINCTNKQWRISSKDKNCSRLGYSTIS